MRIDSGTARMTGRLAVATLRRRAAATLGGGGPRADAALGFWEWHPFRAWEGVEIAAFLLGADVNSV